MAHSMLYRVAGRLRPVDTDEAHPLRMERAFAPPQEIPPQETRPQESPSQEPKDAPEAIRPEPVPSSIEGFVERFDGRCVIGWVHDAAVPGRRVAVEVSADGVRKVVPADIHRQDLMDAGKGDGRHGFVAVLDGALTDASLVDVRVAATGEALAGSPLRTDLVSRIAHPGNQRALEDARVEFGLAILALGGGLRAARTSAWAPAERDEAAPPIAPYPTRARIDTLMEPAAPEADPEGLVSRYLDYEVRRMKLDEVLALRGTLQERIRVLHWYLTDYAPRRGFQIALARAQLDFLNAPVPVLGLDVEVSVAAYSFITAELGPRNLNDPESLREALYWWCVERSVRIAPGGELNTPAQVRALSYAGPQEAGLAFPLNDFARRYHGRDTALHALDLGLDSARALFVFILIVRSVAQPHITPFLPHVAVAELLSADGSGQPSRFDAIAALMLGSERNAAMLAELLSGSGEAAHGGASDLARLRALIRDHLARAGFPLGQSGHAGAAGTRAAKRHAALCLKLPSGLAPGLEPGVAVIGPTRATSGLGQATRLSIDVLDHAGLDPAVLDFSIDNPAPKGFASPIKGRPLRAPRRINLLHLNAESIPLALACLDAPLYDRSYNIGYFFWELDRIPGCHDLALRTLDEIWVSSEYNREIYSRYADIPVVNVGMAVEPLAAPQPVSRAEFGLGPDEFVFLATFDSFSFVERKNPLGVLAAFRKAFPLEANQKVGLVLKTQNRSRVFDPHQIRIWRAIDAIAQSDPRIRVIDQTLTYRELLGFKAMCDAYVSLHRSEGWGFGLIEAMQLRLPVITTGYSGNMEFCSPETARLVDYELVPPTAQEYIFVERGSRWADPCTDDAAGAMRAVFTDRAQATARAELAFHRARQGFGVARIAERYRARLSEIERTIAARTGS